MVQLTPGVSQIGWPFVPDKTVTVTRVSVDINVPIGVQVVNADLSIWTDGHGAPGNTLLASGILNPGGPGDPYPTPDGWPHGEVYAGGAPGSRVTLTGGTTYWLSTDSVYALRVCAGGGGICESSPTGFWGVCFPAEIVRFHVYGTCP